LHGGGIVSREGTETQRTPPVPTANGGGDDEHDGPARHGPLAGGRFPSRGQRMEFLGQVSLWNKVEGLPRIETVSLGDGLRVRFRSADPAQRNILRLIDAFGGFVDARECRIA